MKNKKIYYRIETSEFEVYDKNEDGDGNGEGDGPGYFIIEEDGDGNEE